MLADASWAANLQEKTVPCVYRTVGLLVPFEKAHRQNPHTAIPPYRRTITTRGGPGLHRDGCSGGIHVLKRPNAIHHVNHFIGAAVARCIGSMLATRYVRSTDGAFIALAACASDLVTTSQNLFPNAKF